MVRTKFSDPLRESGAGNIRSNRTLRAACFSFCYRSCLFSILALSIFLNSDYCHAEWLSAANASTGPNSSTSDQAFGNTGSTADPNLVGHGDGLIHIIPALSSPSVKNGGKLAIRAVVKAAAGVREVKAEIRDGDRILDTLDLHPGSSDRRAPAVGLWEAEWTGHDLEEKEYSIILHVTDLSGHSFEDGSLRFTDPTAGITTVGTTAYAPAGAAGMRRIGALPAVAVGLNSFASAVVDTTNGYAYFGTNTAPGNVIKVALGTGATQPTVVGVAPLNAGENNLTCAIIDAANGFAYFGTSTSPGIVVKIKLGAGAAAPARVAALALSALLPPENNLTSAVIDTTNGYGYFGATGLLGVGTVVKVSLAGAMARIGAAAFNAGELTPVSGVVDTAAGFAYFGTSNAPGVVVKIALGAGAAVPTRVGALTLAAGENNLTCAVIDTTAKFAYFGTSTTAGKVVKVNLTTFLATATLNVPGTTNLTSAIIDPAGAYAWFGSGNSPALVQKLNLGTFALTGRLTLVAGENQLVSAVIDAAAGYGYFGTNTAPGNVVKVALSENGYLKGTKTTLLEAGDITGVSFYSHNAKGNVRLAIYDDATPRNLLWESGLIANTATAGWLTVPIASGTPTSLALAMGSYQLTWQVDTNADVPSYTAGVLGDGLYISRPFGAAPAQLDPLLPTISAEKWSMYVTYNVIPPPNAITITPSIAGPTNADDLDFVVTFDKPVVNFNNSNDLVINTLGTVAFTGTSLTGGPTTYTVHMSGITGDGSLNLAAKTALAGSDIRDLYDQGLASSVTTSVVIDNTVIPPSIPDLIAASDTGILNSDDITNDVTPTFSGTAEANATVQLYVDGSLEGSAIAGNTGSWSITTGTLPEGSRGIEANQIDEAGNVSGNSGTLKIVIDTTVPTILSQNPVAGSTVAALPNVAATFTEDVFNVVAGNLTVGASPASTRTGSGAGPYSFSGYANPPDGTVNVVFGAGTIIDVAGNAFAGDNWSYTKNSAAITVTLSSSTVADGGATNVSPVLFTATFSQGVMNFLQTDITVTGGAAGGFLQVNPSTYTFNVTPVAGPVSVQIMAGVANGVAPPNSPNSASLPYLFTYDTTAPTVVTITPSTTGPTSADTVTFTVNFSENVVNFDADNDLVINHTGTANGGITINGGPQAYTVDVNGITGDGSFTLAVKTAAGGSDVRDLAGNGLASSVTSAAVLIDNTGPTVVTITPASVGPTNAASMNFTVTFNGPVVNFNDAADVEIAETGVSHAGVTITGGPTAYNVNVTGITGDGTMLLAVKIEAQGTDTQDPAGNGVQTSVTSAAVLFDHTSPNATNVTPSTTGPTNAASVTFTVDFDEPVQTFNNAADLVFVETGSVAHVGVAISGGPQSYSVNVTGITGSGTMTLAVKTAGGGSDVRDLATNGLASSVTSAAVQFDHTAPTVVITSPASPGPTSLNPIPVTITFSEPVTGFVLADIVVTNGAAGNLQTSDNQTYTVDVSPSANPTTVSVNVAASVAVDQVGNGNLVAPAFSINFASPRPVVTLNTAAPDPTNLNVITVTVVFSAAVTGFDPINETGDLILTNATLSGFTPISGTNYTLDIAPVGDGVFSAQVPASIAMDVSSNPNDPSNVLQRTSDRTGPAVVSIAPSTPGPTNVDTVDFVVTFDGAVTGFNAASDVIVNHTGTAHTTVTFAQLTTSTYRVTVNGISGDGTVSLSVATPAAQDPAGNSNPSISPASSDVTIDNTPPSGTPPNDQGASTINPLLVFDWLAPTDNLSGVATIGLQVGTSLGGNDVYNASVTGTTANVGGNPGQTLYARLILIDNAGNFSITPSSDGIDVLNHVNDVTDWGLYE